MRGQRTAPRAELVAGRIIHLAPLAPPEVRCHAGAGHDDNVRDRGAAGFLCVPCWRAVSALIARIIGQEPS